MSVAAADHPLLDDMISADAAIGHGVGYRFNFLLGWLYVRQRNAHNDRVRRMNRDVDKAEAAVERLVDAYHATYQDLDDNVLNAEGRLPSVELARLITLLETE